MKKLLLLILAFVLVHTAMLTQTLNSTQKAKIGVVGSAGESKLVDSLGAHWWYVYGPGVVGGYAGTREQQMFMFKPLNNPTGTGNLSVAQIQAFVAAAKAKYPSKPVYWMLGNEPNLRGQDNMSATTFAPLYKKYYDAIKAADPTAKILGPSLVFWDANSWYPTFSNAASFFHSDGSLYGKEWYISFRNKYNQLYGTYPPMDVFNIHLYDFSDLNSQGVNYQHCLNEYNTIVADIATFPELSGKPIWITETGVLTNGFQPEASIAQKTTFMANLFYGLTAHERVEKLFWFWTDYYPPSDPNYNLFEAWNGSSLLNEQRNRSALGTAFYNLVHDTPSPTPFFTVTHPGDTPDANPGDGTCADASGACTLRAAIQEANALPGAQEVRLIFDNALLTDPDVAVNGDEYVKISLNVALPIVSGDLILSGRYQPGASCGNDLVPTLPGGKGKKLRGVRVMIDFSTLPTADRKIETNSGMLRLEGIALAAWDASGNSVGPLKLSKTDTGKILLGCGSMGGSY